jgi:hypothetical protein
MLERRFAGLLIDDFHRQEIGEDGQRFRERAAFIMAGDQTCGFQHGNLSL